MGAMNLGDMEAEVQSTMGDRGFDSPRLDRWINLGYFDLTGSIDFEDLTLLSTISTTASTSNYPIPVDATVVKAVTVDKGLARWVPKVEYLRLDRTTVGTPTKWTRIGEEIFLQPTPSAVVGLELLTKKDPVALSASGDVTVLPATWDAAVLFLAIHHGLMAVGEEQRAAFWLQRAVSYASSRITDDMIQNTSAGMGSTLGNSSFQNALMAQMQQREKV